MSRNTRILAVVGAAAALAITGFVLLRPSDDEPSPSAVTTTTATTTPQASVAVPKPTVIALKGGRPVGGKQAIEVRKGDVVRLKVTSDDAEEIHVHGYDIEQKVSLGKPATFRFTADIEGRFEVESHTTETQIAELTVNP